MTVAVGVVWMTAGVGGAPVGVDRGTVGVGLDESVGVGVESPVGAGVGVGVVTGRRVVAVTVGIIEVVVRGTVVGDGVTDGVAVAVPTGGVADVVGTVVTEGTPGMPMMT
ncbi:MAG TPA: hypothetical protein PK089_04760, partial [Methanoregulaceae archaeon]|nr:hypothetical protein [Methanoregulaceae archaeon]